MSVVVSDVMVNLLHQFADAAEGTAPDGLLGDAREPALDLIEPAGVGRSAMKVVARTARQPGSHPGMLVGGVVVRDQMDLEVGRDVAVEVLEKAQKLLMPMARFA